MTPKHSPKAHRDSYAWLYKIYIWFFAFCKRLVQRKRILSLILIFPLLCLAVSAYSSKAEPLIQVALYNKGGSDLATETIHKLEDTHDVIHFYHASSLDELYTDVQNTTAECGYIFTEDYSLEHILEQPCWEGSVQVIESPGSMLTGAVNELVFSSFFRLYNKELLREYLAQDGVLKKPKEIPLAQADSDAIFDIHCADGSTFAFAMNQNQPETDPSKAAKKINEEAYGIKKAFLTNMCRGILSVLILLAALCGLLILQEDRKSSLFLPLPSRQQPVMELLEVLAPTFLTALGGFIGICILPAHQALTWEATSLMIYVLEASLGVCLLGRLIHQTSYIQATIPLLTLGALIFAPVFLDFSAYARVMTIPKYLFLNSYYLNMATGGWTDLIRLAAVTLVFAALSLIGQKKASAA